MRKRTRKRTRDKNNEKKQKIRKTTNEPPNPPTPRRKKEKKEKEKVTIGVGRLELLDMGIEVVDLDGWVMFGVRDNCGGLMPGTFIPLLVLLSVDVFKEPPVFMVELIGDCEDNMGRVWLS